MLAQSLRQEWVRTPIPIPGVDRVDKVGPDTTQLSLSSMILGLIAFPDAVTKVQEELDRVVGDRMPTFEDSPNLPYIRAMVKEVLRWRSVMNNGITHVSTVLDGQSSPMFQSDQANKRMWSTRTTSSPKAP